MSVTIALTILLVSVGYCSASDGILSIFGGKNYFVTENTPII